MADGYYKLALQGAHEEHAIVNVLYYGRTGGLPFATYSAGQANDLITTFRSQAEAFYVASLPAAYELQRYTVSYVNPRGDVDPTTSELHRVVAVPGTEVDTSDGSYNTAILGFSTVVAPITGALLPKRSYVAYGPLISSFIGDNGKLTITANSELNQVAAVLDATLLGDDDFYPVRIGRTEFPNPVRVGYVTDCFVRPYASTRRSRKTRPTGP